ncbi:hypothetical protein C8J56DRAFT_308648 [Mycena floridula]|nr:hypothetical protein C8J56DRAFT_308648 [Mycena floridula]
MPTSTLPFEIMFEFKNDTTIPVTLQLTGQGSNGQPNAVAGQGPVILLQSRESVSLVLNAGSAYHYALKQGRHKKALIIVKAWQDTYCYASGALSPGQGPVSTPTSSAPRL